MFIGDDQRLTQVITNILSNAVKFTPEEGSIYLDSKIKSDKNNMCRVEICISDTGIGITEKQISRLFESFEQADAGTSRNFGGTGLGLSISKRIVELMDGNIWVESEPGKGSKFFISVLLKKGNEKKDKLNENDEEDNANYTDDFSGKTILLAEDIEINREIVITLLEPTNVKIISAENGETAVRIFKESPDEFNLIFMDIQMPEMDGYDATRSIRDFEKTLTENGKTRQPVPIIAMTANVFREDIEKCLGAGMNGHVKKPIELDEMVNFLRQYL